MPLKLLTLNVHAWQEENQEKKLDHLVKTIFEEQYDVIALQEVSQHRDQDVVEGQIKADNYGYILQKKLKELGSAPYEMVWAPCHYGYEVFEEGIALLTRHPIIESTDFYVTKSREMKNWKSRNIVGALIEIDNKPIHFYSCHLGWWEDTEEPARGQMDALLEQIPADGRVFLMGDFNNHADMRNEGYDYLIQNGFYDTFTLADEKDSGVTVEGKIAGWDQNKRGIRIDLILTNQKVNVFSSKVIFNGRNRDIVSDHFGVEAVITE
ncbi:endonuclease/exonuclease/phosphatase [Alkalihalophilus pseudofirmus OF4]|uniref:Endonuclease/exonuclease/phosphatase n=1 Tax=Alkalihalophilus pseudofirmus (strain ATCC BAA-2126 / JCM 17055 / OF4) TaxID=398511 RepID=D3FQ72_ALKPO|nr:endonuclease/exonuclease/phosphatase [Alkalihalophilus pseudofirmus OF4]